MNFEQAVQEMIHGNRVRLSDWIGYWFMPDGKFIKVFTRDGDILDEANVTRYQNRDDWEIVTETGWSFDMALRFMKNGKEITRSGFPEHASMCILGEKIYVSIHLAGSINTILNDILANDWQIVNS
jgi:elongation factor P hydroxylase